MGIKGRFQERTRDLMRDFYLERELFFNLYQSFYFIQIQKKPLMYPNLKFLLGLNLRDFCLHMNCIFSKSVILKIIATIYKVPCAGTSHMISYLVFKDRNDHSAPCYR